MTDLFDEKNIKPMLIGSSGEAFDDPAWIFELKLDGERCLAYLDPASGSGTELRNKRNMKMLPKVPELSGIHTRVSLRCILDGELIVFRDGKPDFFEIQRRSLTSDPFRIKLSASKSPACFIAFDILYGDGEDYTGQPLSERKKLLESAVNEDERLSVSRVIDEKGRDFYDLTVQNGLEGVVAKLKASRYVPDSRTKDWIKIKNLADDDFVVCGYAEKESGTVSVPLGQYSGGRLIYSGHVTLGISSYDYRFMRQAEKSGAPPYDLPVPDDGSFVWLKPRLVCTVKYMMKTSSGSMRQPVFKGIRFDKSPADCTASLN